VLAPHIAPKEALANASGHAPVSVKVTVSSLVALSPGAVDLYVQLPEVSQDIVPPLVVPFKYAVTTSPVVYPYTVI
jgi:hypothetical protein